MKFEFHEIRENSIFDTSPLSLREATKHYLGTNRQLFCITPKMWTAGVFKATEKIQVF